MTLIKIWRASSYLQFLDRGVNLQLESSVVILVSSFLNYSMNINLLFKNPQIYLKRSVVFSLGLKSTYRLIVALKELNSQ